MDFYTYLHCRPDGTPFYVGKGRGKRAYQLRKGRNIFHRRVVEKYGADNIGIFVFPCGSEITAFSDEKQQIAAFRAEGFVLSNLADGGEGAGGVIRSEETRRKLSLAITGKKMSAESSAKKSAATRGKKHSAEHVAKVAAANRGKKRSAAYRMKMSKIVSGIKRPERSVLHRARLSAAVAAHWVLKRNRLTSSKV